MWQISHRPLGRGLSTEHLTTWMHACLQCIKAEAGQAMLSVLHNTHSPTHLVATTEGGKHTDVCVWPCACTSHKCVQIHRHVLRAARSAGQRWQMRIEVSLVQESMVTVGLSFRPLPKGPLTPTLSLPLKPLLFAAPLRGSATAGVVCGPPMHRPLKTDGAVTYPSKHQGHKNCVLVLLM